MQTEGPAPVPAGRARLPVGPATQTLFRGRLPDTEDRASGDSWDGQKRPAPDRLWLDDRKDSEESFSQLFDYFLDPIHLGRCREARKPDEDDSRSRLPLKEHQLSEVLVVRQEHSALGSRKSADLLT